MIARAWDAINDPMMGVLVDKCKSPAGKCRHFLRLCSMPAGICVFLSYYVPGFLSSGKVVWVAVMYILQGMAQTSLSVPLNTMLVHLTQDRVERAKLGQYMSIGVMVANLAIPAITLPLVKYFGHDNMQQGFMIVAAIYGAVYAISHLAVYWGTKGFEQSDEDLIAAGLMTPQENVRFGDTVKAFLQNKYCLVVALTYLLYCVYSTLMGSSLVFYVTYNLMDQKLLTPYSTLSTVTGIIPILIMVYLVKKLGTAGTTIFSCILVAIGMFVRLIFHDGNLPALFFGWAMEGIGVSLFGTMTKQCMVDSMTYGEWKTGVSNQAVLMSVLTFAQKLGQAFGGVAAAALLGVFGYVANAETQSETVKNLFFVENVTLPLIIFVVNILLLFVVRKFEKQIPMMKAEIAQRSGRAAEPSA